MAFLVYTIKRLSEANLNLRGRKKSENTIAWQYKRFSYKTSVVLNVYENKYSAHFDPRKTFYLRDLDPRLSCCPYSTVLQRIEF
jgi:hypothetical protein